MKKLTMVLMVLVLVVGGCLCGCIVLPKGDASAGFRQAATLEFFHTAPDEGAEFRVDLLPWIQDEIKARREAAMILEAADAVEDDG